MTELIRLNELENYNELFMNNENSEYRNYHKNRLFHQFTALTISANLWNDVAGHRLAKRAKADDCAKPYLYLSAISAK